MGKPASTNDIWFAEWLRLTDESTKAAVRQHIKSIYGYQSPTMVETIASDRDRLLGGVYATLAEKAGG